ncbi:MAG: Calx-beta domain-containing protein [Leucobacter sp.]
MSRAQLKRIQGTQGLRFGRRLLAGVAAIAMLGGAGLATAAPALADDPATGTSVVQFADTEMLACVNDKLGGGRPANGPVTDDDLNTIFGLSCSSQFAVTSLDGIEHAQKITNLFFAGGKHNFSAPGSLAAAAMMPKLNSLTLTDANVTNASFTDVGDIAGLTTLSLTGSPELSDLAPLSSLAKLSRLDVSRNVKLEDLSPLRDSTTLRDFTASQNPLLVDLSPLGGLMSLTSVSVYKTAVETLEPLSELTNITDISAGYTNVTTLEPLAKLVKIRNLSFDYAKLQSLAGIEDMAALRTLDVNYNSDIGDDIGALGDKPELSRIHMNAIGATSLKPLFGLTGLTSLQALGNGISSLEGFQEAPETASKGSFAVTAQRITGPEKYVPKGAKLFRHDATGQLANRDGSFPAPGGNLKPTPAPELPLINIEVIKAWPDLEYTFAEEGKSNDRFTGTVAMPIVWSSITSDDSATVPLGEKWQHEVTFTDGFPMAEVTLSDTAPKWLSVKGSVLSGQPEVAGDWTFDVRVADALGNTMTQRFDITVPKPNTSFFEISEDQEIVADGDDEVEFEVSRTDTVENPYTGEASVRVRTVDGTAKAGEHYEALDTTVTWDANDSEPVKAVSVKVFGGDAGSDEVALTVELSDPTPDKFTELGGGFTTDLTIAYPTAEPSEFSISKPQLVTAAAKQPGHKPGNGEQEVTFTVTRADSDTHPWTGDASVAVKITDPRATDGDDYSAVIPLTWKRGDAAEREISITVKPGSAGDPKRLLALRVIAADPLDPYAKPAALPLSALTITYPKPDATSFAISADQSGLAGSNFSFEVSREDAAANPWTGEASVRVETTDGTAVAGTHYTAHSERLTWAAGDTAPKTVVVETLAVPAGDPKRTFDVVLSEPEPSAFSLVADRGSATVTLKAAVPNATVFSVGDDQRGVAGDLLTFTLSRSDAEVDPWTGEASVRVRTVDGSAVAGEHYEAVDAVVTWAAGDTAEKTVDVVTTRVASGESERAFTLTLAEPSEHTALGDRGSAIGTVTYEKGETPGGDGDGDGGPGPKPGTDGDSGKAPGQQPGGPLANSGASSPVWALTAGAGALALAAGGLILFTRVRRTQ